MAYALGSIEQLYTNGVASIMPPELAGAIFIFFFLGIVFLRNMPTIVKIVIGVPSLFIGFSIMGIISFNVLFAIGLGMLFVFALWKLFNR